MNDMLVTLLLLSIGVAAIFLGCWLVDQRIGDRHGGNTLGDPRARSADSAMGAERPRGIR